MPCHWSNSSPSLRPLCSTATRSNRSRKRRMVCGVSAISGTSTIAAAAGRDAAVERVEIHLRLAAARDAVQQERAMRPGLERGDDRRRGGALRWQQVRRRRGGRRAARASGSRSTHALAERDDADIGEPADRRRIDGERRAKLGERAVTHRAAHARCRAPAAARRLRRRRRTSSAASSGGATRRDVVAVAVVADGAGAHEPLEIRAAAGDRAAVSTGSSLLLHELFDARPRAANASAARRRRCGGRASPHRQDECRDFDRTRGDPRPRQRILRAMKPRPSSCESTCSALANVRRARRSSSSTDVRGRPRRRAPRAGGASGRGHQSPPHRPASARS